MNSLSAIYAIAAAGMMGVPEMPRRRDVTGDPSTWRRRCGARNAGHTPAAAGKSFVRSEVERLLGAAKQFPSGWRHRVTGQVRYFDAIEATDTAVRCVQFDRGGRLLCDACGAGKPLVRSFADTLQWLRNAEEVAHG